LSGSPNQKNQENQNGGSFNFKVKIVQKDLNSDNYISDFSNLAGSIFGGFQSENPIVYQNSGYISKLYFINNFSGGILRKDKIEDMPESYRRFVQPENPSDAQIIKNLQKELIMLSNREEVGQNVFYSRLSSAGAASVAGSYETAQNFDSSGSFVLFDEFDGEEYDENEDYEEYDEDDEEDYDYDNEEIKEILHMNNYFNSDMYKMSKVEYDFSVPGTINFTEGGFIEITYDESEITGLEGSYIQFLFKPQEKDILTVRRRSFFDMWFTLEKGKRVSTDETETKPKTELDLRRFTKMALTTHTKELVNNMTADGGEIRLVYVTETNGVPSEMIFHTIQAERVGN